MAPKHPTCDTRLLRVEGAESMSTFGFEGLGQLQLGTRSPKVALEKLFMAATNVVPAASAATEDAITE